MGAARIGSTEAQSTSSNFGNYIEQLESYISNNATNVDIQEVQHLRFISLIINNFTYPCRIQFIGVISHDCEGNFTDPICEIMHSPIVSCNKLIGFHKSGKHSSGINLFIIKWQNILNINPLLVVKLIATRSSVTVFKTIPKIFYSFRNSDSFLGNVWELTFNVNKRHFLTHTQKKCFRYCE